MVLPIELDTRIRQQNEVNRIFDNFILTKELIPYEIEQLVCKIINLEIEIMREIEICLINNKNALYVSNNFEYSSLTDIIIELYSLDTVNINDYSISKSILQRLDFDCDSYISFFDLVNYIKKTCNKVINGSNIHCKSNERIEIKISLSNILSKMIKFEREKEEYKLLICKQNDISLNMLFTLFSKTNIVTERDFSEGCLNFLSQYITVDEITLVFNKLKSDSSNSLSYHEFNRLFLPYNNKLYDHLIHSKSSHISIESIIMISNYLHFLVFNESILNEFKTILCNSNISLYEEFMKLRSKVNNNIIESESLIDYFRSINVVMYKEDVDLFVKSVNRRWIKKNSFVRDEAKDITFKEFTFCILSSNLINNI